MSEARKVRYSDWMEGSHSEDEHNWDKVFNKDKFDKGGKGHLLLQLQKSYKGDDRFRLDTDDFGVDVVKDKGEHGGKIALPETMLGSLSKRERDALGETGKKRKNSDVVMEAQKDDLDTGTIQWEPELDMEREKTRLFGVLAKFVPQTEIFF